MLYADDMQLYLSCDMKNLNNAITDVNTDLTYLFKWCCDHGLSLNISKCKPMIIGYSRLHTQLDYTNIIPISINGNSLEYEKSLLNLGLRMNEIFTWKDQVEYIHKKVYQCIYRFKRLCFKPSIEIKKLLVSRLVFPVFDYANLAYCDLNDQLVSKLQRAQNACIRYIFNLKLDEHVTSYYLQLKWLKVKERMQYGTMCLLFKILKVKKPDYLYETYETMQNVHGRQTRFGSTTLQFPLHRTMFYNNSFHVQSIRLMNSLEDEIKEAVSDRVFKAKLKSKLLNLYQST